MRGFVPEELSVRAQVFDRLYRVIESYGCARYDGPLLEPLEPHESESSQEIVSEQTHQLVDRGGRALALRLKTTLNVSRIIAGHAGELRIPIRCCPHVNCFRYERPQRGRVREHWQIDVDIFGADS